MHTVNAALRSDDPRGRILSNLSAHGFVMDGIRCESVEGFIQGIKFPPEDPRRARTFALAGVAAWKMRAQAKNEYVWWGNNTFLFNSPEHRTLILRAIEAKFVQNDEALAALVATSGLNIVHHTGAPEPPNTSLPARLYCDTLTRIREAALRGSRT